MVPWYHSGTMVPFRYRGTIQVLLNFFVGGFRPGSIENRDVTSPDNINHKYIGNDIRRYIRKYKQIYEMIVFVLISIFVYM